MNKKFVVVDEIMDMLEAAKSGVVPGSVDQAIVSSSQNVPGSVVQHSINGGASGASYLTFPIHPLKDNCCIDKTYINLEPTFNFTAEVKFPSALNDTQVIYIPFWFGLRDGASYPNHLQVMIESNSIYDSTFQREEATVAYCSMPESAIRGNSQYASIEKMILNKRSPMKRVLLKATATSGATQTFSVKINYKITQDVDSLTPMLSNLHFTTPHMGNLQIREYFQDVQNALFFCPDYNWINNNKVVLAGTSQANIEAGINSSLNQPNKNQYWSFYPLADYLSGAIPKAQIPFYASVETYTDNTHTTLAKIETIIPDSVQFMDPIQAGTAPVHFMSFSDTNVAEIVQTTFKIRNEEYERLTQYFAAQGSIIIPTQTWTTGVFNNSVQTQGNWSSSMIGTINGYNIDFISVWAHSASHAAFNWEPLNNIQLLINGIPVNALPYQFVNEKCITDCVQAIIDTDHEEINHDYLDSLNFLNLTEDVNYIDASAHKIYGTGANGSSIRTSTLRNPNLFCLNFATNLPSAFHSGACTLEAVNNQANIRFNSNKTANTAFSSDRDKFPHWFNNQSLPSGFSQTTGFCALCDACIYLNFDATRNRAFDGILSWAAPYE